MGKILFSFADFFVLPWVFTGIELPRYMGLSPGKTVGPKKRSQFLEEHRRDVVVALRSIGSSNPYTNESFYAATA